MCSNSCKYTISKLWIGDMQNEMYFYDHYNEFEYNHDFLKVLWKIGDVMKDFGVLDSNVYLLLRRNNVTV